MGLEIINYSFHDLNEYAHNLGIVDLAEEVNERLKQYFEFELPPPQNEIRDRCKRIVQYALDNDHSAVFIRNNEIFQINLIQEFQNNRFRVFVPYYLSHKYNEIDHTNEANLKTIDIVELAVISHPLYSVSRITMSQQHDGYQIYIMAEQKTAYQVRFDLVNGAIDDVIHWFQEFADQIIKRSIRAYLLSSLGVLFTNQDLFVEELIRILVIVNEKISIHLHENINSELIQKISEIIQTVSIIDSDEVQEYLVLTDHAVKEYNHDRVNTIVLLNLAIDLLNGIDLKAKEVIIRFDTKSFIKLGIDRIYKMSFNPAYLCRFLGFYYLISGLNIDSEHNLQRSIGLYHCYNENEIDYQEIDKTLLNLIFVNIVLNRYDVAKSLIQNRISEIEPEDHELQSKLKGLLSTIYRNTGEYSLALDTIRDLKFITDEDRNPEEYYQLEVRKAIINYMEGKISDSLLLLNSIITSQKLPILMRSHSSYLYSLILFSDEKRVSEALFVKLAKYKDDHIIIDSYHRLVEILSMIEKSGPTATIKEKLTELAYLYPDQEIKVISLLGAIYTREGEWTPLSALIESTMESFSQYSPHFQIKLYLCKYYLGVIDENEDVVAKNMVQKLGKDHEIDISSFNLDNSKGYAIKQLNILLDMDLVKIENRFFDLDEG